jgi:hypothetical protein
MKAWNRASDRRCAWFCRSLDNRVDAVASRPHQHNPCPPNPFCGEFRFATQPSSVTRILRLPSKSTSLSAQFSLAKTKMEKWRAAGSRATEEPFKQPS